MTTDRPTAPDHHAPVDAFLRGVDRRADLRAALLAAGGPTDPHAPFELRPALPDDRVALLGVARRDGAPLPDGPLMLAEVAGTPIAAIGLENRRVVADPVWPTTRAVDALRAAAAEHDPWPSRWARVRVTVAGLRRRDARRRTRRSSACP